MKIEKITLCNLTSLEGEQVIDFGEEPLRSAGLFAITGDTGAGKSTILDAICLALYNKAPRFEEVDTIRDIKQIDKQAIQTNDVRNVLRRGCKEAYIKVVFSTVDGSHYEATWNLRLKRTGTYDKVVRTLKQLSPHKESYPENEIQERIKNLTGLDYQQFSRTVMLAQNSFANFLRAKRGEKSALLEKLTGTEIYGEISKKIYAMAMQAARECEALENEVKGIMTNHLDEHILAKTKEEQMLLSSSLDSVMRRIEMTEKQLKWFDDYDNAVALVNRAEEQNVAANKEYVNRRSDEIRLQRYDEVIDVQPLYQELIVRKADIDAGMAKKEDMAKTLTAMRPRLSEAEDSLQLAQKRTADAEEGLRQKLPSINQGHSLLGEIRVGEAQLQKLGEQLREEETMLAERRDAMEAKKQLMANILAKLEELKAKSQMLLVHKAMFEKYDLVKDKISLLRSESTRSEEFRKKHRELQIRQASLAESAAKADNKFHQDQEKLDSLKSELAIHRQANRGRDGIVLQQRYSDNRSKLLKLEHAQSLWQRISDGYAEISEKQAEISRNKSLIEQSTKEIEAVFLDTEVLEETFKRLSFTYTLSQSQNITNLRRQLKEGTACPVCGATHHPYRSEAGRELGNLLNNMEREYNDTLANLNAKRQKLNAMRQELALSEGRLRADEEHLQECQKRQKEDVKMWDEYSTLDPSFADCSPTVNREARRIMIGMLIDNTIRAASEAQKELDTFNYHQKLINSLNEEIGKLEQILSDARIYLEDIGTERKIIIAQDEDVQKQMLLSEKTCNELYSDLDEMVTLQDWFKELKSNPDGLRLKITSLFDAWNKNTTELEEKKRDAELLAKEIKSAEYLVGVSEKHLTSIRDMWAKTNENIQEKREQLRRLFGNELPDIVAERLQKQVAAARMAEQEARKQFEAINYSLKQCQGQLQTLTEDCAKKQEIYRDRASQMDIWILKFNGNHSPVQMSELHDIFQSKTNWNDIRAQIDGLKEACTLSKNKLESQRAMLAEVENSPYRPSSRKDDTKAELTAAAESLRQDEQQLRNNLTTVELKLANHKRCEETVAEMKESIDRAHSLQEDWKRLNDLVGSAEGNKFRELAQSYTFAMLVEHANIQLKMLSPRYEMRIIPGTLMPEIIDRDMFDETRYVSSLSGGETFVVSLALALGLASLSGHNISIGSLFIDEGFGNLDHDSLELVMDALGNLENEQGRKVGVISHTEQIRSQISPQIRVKKLPAGGKSIIEIV